MKDANRPAARPAAGRAERPISVWLFALVTIAASVSGRREPYVRRFVMAALWGRNVSV
jgi:hypothetical protein